MLKFPLHHQFKYILFHELKHEIQLVIILYDFIQPYDVRMVKFFKHLDFIEVDTLFPVGVLLLYLLNGYNLFGLLVDGLNDRSKAAVSQIFA
jgi:hypothetical protein